MNRISRCGWLPERARWSARDTGFVPQVHRSCFGVLSHIINPLLTKLARSRWLDTGLVLVLRVYEQAKKERGQYPAILTSRLVNNPYLFTASVGNQSKGLLIDRS